ncbi:hypothetical protein BN85404400 [Alteracholeplasma palmae J233]|uniref:Uncharacterized protein n=1 Tax=Alteracholeplasma palmae (strain ATCC 49389 / J233) TaxID=1318466 RepID=U4KKB8_ALTPJ|nr:hypothetical protein [Alteracholeplasma palmae]CCV64017.1 hypothetical protein BN85404400 [Alteracholeplasma palmae J233]
MNCCICNKRIIQEITINNFFKKVHHEVCLRCKTKFYHKNTHFGSIPIKNYLLHLHIIGKNIDENDIGKHPYLKDAIQIYSKEPQNYDMIILIIDMVDEELVKLIANLNLSDIILITMIHKGEMNYEI